MMQVHKRQPPKSSDEIHLTQEFSTTLELLENSETNYFITGNAGTGKTTLIKLFAATTEKRIVLLAPTGIAALNLGGQTIHSFFRFPAQIIRRALLEGRKNVDSIYKEIECVIIDEVSMVRADVLDGIDQFLRMYGRRNDLPFGGTQIILVGDPFQLPPVVTTKERPFINRIYKSPFFFSSHSFATTFFKTINLLESHRQIDPKFIDILNKVRLGQVDSKILKPLNARIAKPLSKKQRRTNVCLVPTNKAANTVNLEELNKLEGTEFVYDAEITGLFPDDKSSLIPRALHLRKGARVMFLKNMLSLVNGSTGTITKLKEDEIKMKTDDSNKVVSIPRVVISNIKYSIDKKTKRVEEDVLGNMGQYPLRLAWAITVHKSQGMTFDQVEVDFSDIPFAEGQTYVALSRCRSMEGLTVTRPIRPKDIFVDARIVNFVRSLNL